MSANTHYFINYNINTALIPFDKRTTKKRHIIIL